MGPVRVVLWCFLVLIASTSQSFSTAQVLTLSFA